MEKMVAAWAGRPSEPGFESWRGRRVFLTGHTGFKGGWLALWLRHLGATVSGYSLDPPTTPSLFAIARVAEHIADIRGDIRDLAALQQAMQSFAPEVVFHLAAQPLVRQSYLDPASTYATNVSGTVHVLEAIRHTPSVRAALCVTTDKCYQNRGWPWGYREDDRLGGHDPYSSSKACAELACAAYRDSYFAASGLALATARAGNVIGGGDWAQDRLIPDLVRGLISRETVTIRNPHAIRPWQHVLEPLHGYLLLAERLLSGDPSYASSWNFGPSESGARPVAWIAEELSRMWPEAARWQSASQNEAQPHEATCLKLDCSKAHACLNWRPALDLTAALQLTVDWTRAWQSGVDMQIFTLGQIAEYQQLCSAAPQPEGQYA